jgi:hypothetical protein
MRVYFNTLVLNSKYFCFFQIIALRSGFFFCSHITMDVLVVLFGFDCDYRRSGCVFQFLVSQSASLGHVFNL